MKNKYLIITLIVILTILMVGLSIFFVKLLQSDFKFSGFKFGLQSSNELILDQTYEEKFNKIIIDSSISEINIKKSNDDNIKAIIYGEKDHTDVATNNDTLNIKISEEKCVGFCFNQKSSKVEIYLPEDFNGDINIKNNYGDIYIDELLNANIDIEEDCGDVKILGGNNIKIDNNYGDIEIGESNIVNINEDCGDVSISNVNDVTVINNYGDIKINAVNNYLNLENDCGNIKVKNINLQKDSYIKDDYGDIEIGKTNELFIYAATDLGKVKINNNYNKSDITLKIENDCGDIKVNN